jgi:hypothetical protein
MPPAKRQSAEAIPIEQNPIVEAKLYGRAMGPAMSKLDKREQLFVVLLCESNLTIAKGAATTAAEMAGFGFPSRDALRHRVSYMLQQDEMQAAIQEVFNSRKKVSAVAAFNRLEALSTSADEKIALAANVKVVEFGGIADPTQTINVNHQHTVELTGKALNDRIAELVTDLGPNLAPGLRRAVADAIDVPFEEVTASAPQIAAPPEPIAPAFDPTAGLEDVLGIEPPPLVESVGGFSDE